MPIFKPEDLKDAKSVTFGANELQDATPASSLEDTRRTSTMMPAEMARARFAAGQLSRPSPEFSKMSPPTATEYQGPFGDYGYDTNLKTMHGGFGASFKQALNPFSWLTAPIGEALTPTNPISASHPFNPNEAKPGSPEYNPTLLNLPSRVASTLVPNLSDIYKESYSRGEKGQSTSDLYGPPAAMGATLGLSKLPRAILPADVAGERAAGFMRSALGTKPKNFDLGATPDKTALESLEGVGKKGLVTRSEGRLLNKIKTAKNAELDALEKDVSVPGHETNISDPMQTIQPVIDDAMSRAVPTEATRIAEFQSLLSNKIHSLSGGSMKLNPAQLVQLKRWVDGFVGTYREETTGTLRDLAQNTRSAVREHLNRVAPEATVRGQRIQSLIQAEEALHKKIYTPTPAPRTMLGEVKGMVEPFIPSTFGKTSAAALFKLMSGGQFDQPMLPSHFGSPEFEPAPPTEAAPTPPPPKLLGPPSGMTTTPQGTTIPNAAKTSGMASGLPETPRVAGGVPAFKTGAPFQPDIYNTAINAGQEYLGELKSGATKSGPYMPPPEAPLTPQQEHAQLLEKRDNVIQKAVESHDKPNVILQEEAAKRKAAEISKATMPPKPTHVKEGTQVSGTDQDGNIVSGNLEKFYPTIDETGKPIWKGIVLDLRNSRTVDIPADKLFDRLTGPPKTVWSTTKGETTPKNLKTSKPATQTPASATEGSTIKPIVDKAMGKGFEWTYPDGSFGGRTFGIGADKIQEFINNRIASKTSGKTIHKPAMEAAPVDDKAALSKAPTDKGAAAKKAVQDYLDKMELRQLSEQHGPEGKPKKRK